MIKNSTSFFEKTLEKTSSNIFFLIVSSVSLLVRWIIPANLNVDSPHDDLQGIRLAANLLGGNWLGQWDNTTLLKPPTYPLFLVFTHWIPIQTVVLVHLLLLIIFYWFAKYASVCSNSFLEKNVFKTRIIFTFLAFNPFLFSADFSRIYRNQIYVILLCFIFSGTLHLVSKITLLGSFKDLSHYSRENPLKIKLMSVAIGVASAFLLMTRSESTWLIIPCFSLIIFAVLKNVFPISKREISKPNPIIKVHISVIALLVLSTIMPLILIGQINQNVYGSRLLQNYSSGEFARALNNWEGVLTGQDTRLSVPVSSGQRKAVYVISATAKKLEPYLDDEPPGSSPVSFWRTFNCSTTKICDNSGGAWFPFELRDAAVLAGNITTEVQFQDFFRQIADDIAIACRNELISCGSPGFAPGVRSIQSFPKLQIFSNAVDVFKTWFTLAPMQDPYFINGANHPSQQIWEEVLGENLVFNPSQDKSLNKLQSLLELLILLYTTLTLILFSSTVAYLILPKRKSQSRYFKNFILMGFVSLIIYCVGVGILSIAWGYSALGIYTVPAQPVFLMIIIMATLAWVDSSKNRSTDKAKFD